MTNQNSKLDDLRAALRKAYRERDELPDLIADAEADCDRAIVSNADGIADKIERKLSLLRRSSHRLKLIIPTLERSLDQAEQDYQKEQLADYAQRLGSAFVGVCDALDKLTVANSLAQRIFEEAEETLGPIAQALTRVNWPVHAAKKEHVDFWRETIETSLGLRARIEPQQTPGVFVTFKHQVWCYNPGETAFIQPRQAEKWIKAGLAAVSDDHARAKAMAVMHPREAEPPAPNAEGRVQVCIVQSTRSLRAQAGDDVGAFQPGDLAAFNVDQATRLVRAGYAEFLPWDENPASIAPPAEGSAS